MYLAQINVSEYKLSPHNSAVLLLAIYNDVWLVFIKVLESHSSDSSMCSLS